MRRVPLSALAPDAELAQPVIRGKQVILPAGARVSADDRLRLLRSGVRTVVIRDPGWEGLEVAPILRPETLEAAAALLGGIQAGLARDYASFELPSQELTDLAARIDRDVADSRQPLFLRLDFEGDPWIESAVAGAVLAVLLAQRTGLWQRRRDVALGMLLRDVSLWTAPGLHPLGEGLTGAAVVTFREHPQASLRLLERAARMSAFAKVIALNHHERFDGSGFPQGLRGEQAHPVARLAAVVDAFLARTADFGTGPSMTQGEALDYLVAAAGFEFDVDMVTEFSHVVPPYPPGSLVALSTGYQAVVRRFRGPLARPEVRLIARADGTRLREPIDVDLSAPEQRSCWIERLIV